LWIVLSSTKYYPGFPVSNSAIRPEFGVASVKVLKSLKNGKFWYQAIFIISKYKNLPPMGCITGAVGL